MSVSSKSETKKSGGLGETISVIVQALLLARYLWDDLDAYPPFLWK